MQVGFCFGVWVDLMDLMARARTQETWSRTPAYMRAVWRWRQLHCASGERTSFTSYKWETKSHYPGRWTSRWTITQPYIEGLIFTEYGWLRTPTNLDGLLYWTLFCLLFWAHFSIFLFDLHFEQYYLVFFHIVNLFCCCLQLRLLNGESTEVVKVDYCFFYREI